MTPLASGGCDAAPSGAGADSIHQVAVVIPAHNEEQHLERALTAVRCSAERVGSELPRVGLQIVVVLDSCTDSSAAVAAVFASEDPRCQVLTVSFGSVGMSRQAGVRAVLENATMLAHDDGMAAGVSMPHVWLANTDADSCVPENWLVRQLELAAGGADAVLGSVEPDAHGMHHQLLARWHARHAPSEDHPYVYGANLGVRASSYLAAGGFPGLDFDEDRALVDGLRSSGARLVATDTVRVLTSGRTVGRAPRGFAAYLLALTSP